MSVAVAGRSESNNEKLARGSRDIAIWSHTYGITDEQNPTVMPASMSFGAPTTSIAYMIPIGKMKTKAIAIASMPPLAPPSEIL